MPLVYKIQLMTRVDSTTNPVKSGSVARACSQFFTLSLVFNTKPTSTTAREGRSMTYFPRMMRVKDWQIHKKLSTGGRLGALLAGLPRGSKDVHRSRC